MQTGYPLAYQWQQKHGLLAADMRLLPKYPFVAGGKYELDNLWASDVVQGMKFRASLAQQIHNLPDGTHIRFVIQE